MPITLPSRQARHFWVRGLHRYFWRRLTLTILLVKAKPFSALLGAAVFGLEGSPVGRSLWGKPGLGGFEPARGGAPIEAAALWRR